MTTFDLIESLKKIPIVEASASSAQGTANTAVSKADTAQARASSAYSLAEQAYNRPEPSADRPQSGAYSIGAHILGRCTIGNFNPGAVTAGSNLRAVCSDGTNGASSMVGVGTWRCHGYCYASGTGSDTYAIRTTVWQRIA